jgi:hypothetical protein
VGLQRGRKGKSIMSNQDKIRIKRSQHGEENPYFLEARATAQDDSISYAALGLLSYLLSKPDNWEIIINDLKRTKCGRDKARTLLNELITAKYVIKIPQSQDENGKFTPAYYDVYESPCTENPSTVNPSTVFPALHNTEEIVQIKEKDSPAAPDAQKTDTPNDCKDRFDALHYSMQGLACPDTDCIGILEHKHTQAKGDYWQCNTCKCKYNDALIALVEDTPRIDAQDRLAFQMLSSSSRATIARLHIDSTHSIPLDNALNNAGCLRQITTAPNQEKLYALSPRGELFAQQLNSEELQRARDAVEKDKQRKPKNKREIKCPEDVAPYAACISQAFYGGRGWNDLIATEQKLIIREVNLLRKQYSVDDIDWFCNVWLPKKDWSDTTISALTNGKGHIAKALAERKSVKRQEITIDVED